ncbi:hypothetical protein, partial [Glycomyces tenuis]|uniref:hypothetical protein n=1 Tax=Glycomyces tenuis TaxID=58116 RepID=UPI001B804366
MPHKEKRRAPFGARRCGVICATRHSRRNDAVANHAHSAAAAMPVVTGLACGNQAMCEHTCPYSTVSRRIVCLLYTSLSGLA